MHQPYDKTLDRLAWSIAHRGDSRIPLEERRQLVDLALWQARETYDPDKGTEFSTWAMHCARRLFIEAVEENTTVRVPRTTFRRWMNGELPEKSAFMVGEAQKWRPEADYRPTESEEPGAMDDGDDPTEGWDAGNWKGNAEPWNVHPLEAVEMLPEEDSALLLRWMKGATLEVLAEAEGVSVATVHRRLKGLQEQVKEILEKSAEW